ncbi:hypothetical protein GGR57DRAFT_304644 [Xylariaceae sp. FL1272]|nr:hypothetical protein GGR57DRAFT_304644 [Xylariaceae sp. FL1272]
MASSGTSKPNDPTTSSAWRSLVRESVAQMTAINPNVGRSRVLEKSTLESYGSLDEFLHGEPMLPTFWFFQRRDAFLSQKTMTKWSRDNLQHYILLPATPGFVLRSNTYFVSHFWHSKEHPDPQGEYLGHIQNDLRQHTWSYVWVDWTCAPQEPRTKPEELYFLRALTTMSGIIRNAGFMYWYPPSFEPRLWILYEIAEYSLTCDFTDPVTPDIQPYLDHIEEMGQRGVAVTMAKYGYKCTHDRDRRYLTAWLALLLLLRKLFHHSLEVRMFMDHLTWTHVEILNMYTSRGLATISPFKGVLRLDGEEYLFPPLPEWVCAP